jgi:flagellar FliL protein
MAEKDENAEGGDEIQVGNRSKLPMILGMLGVLAIGGLIGWAVSALTADADPAAAEAEAAANADDEAEEGSRSVDTDMTNLGNYTVNLRDSSGRILAMKIEVESDLASAAKVDERMAQLRDSIILLASDYSYTELEGIDGKFRLKDDIHARINAVLEPTQVRRVYFTEFVVQ